MKEMYTPYEAKMQKALNFQADEFKAIRAGRANPGVLDKLTVEYYGSPTPINQMASISVTEARTLSITPYDKSAMKGIEKAILASDIGINPQNDGVAIRLIFPPLTEERRLALAKQIRKSGEETKVAIRNIRRDAVEKFKEQKKKSEITEDDLKTAEKDMQDMTDKFIKKVDEAVAAKEKEILEV